eukprot:8875886-Pyramimonas_sp.AAC.1
MPSFLLSLSHPLCGRRTRLKPFGTHSRFQTSGGQCKTPLRSPQAASTFYQSAAASPAGSASRSRPYPSITGSRPPVAREGQGSASQRFQ